MGGCEDDGDVCVLSVRVLVFWCEDPSPPVCSLAGRQPFSFADESVRNERRRVGRGFVRTMGVWTSDFYDFGAVTFRRRDRVYCYVMPI